MHKGKWQDRFTDGTYSKCNYDWQNDTEFNLIFLKSNNESRLNVSYKGDIYCYQLLSKEDNYYLLSFNVPGQNAYDIFRMYVR
jgi:hypothetical protein